MLEYILGTVEIILFAWGIVQMEFTKNKRNYLLTWIIFFMGELIYRLSLDINIGVFVGRILCQMVGVLCLFWENMGKRIVKYWFSLLYVTAVYMPVQFVISILCGDRTTALLEVSDRYSILISIVTCILIMILAFVLKKRKNWVQWIRSIPVGYYMIGIMCAAGAQGISSMVKEVSVTQSRKMQIFIWFMEMLVCIFLYGLGILLAFSDLLREQYKRESALKDEYLWMSKVHYEELANHMREVKSIRHDFKAHMNLLESYIEEERWEQARKYLQEMEENQGYQNSVRIDIGNEVVNAVLIDGMRRCDEEIGLRCEGVLPQKLKMSEYDLCTIFSNLLSNSIDACTKLCTKEKVISLQIKHFRDNLMILIENPIEWGVPLEKIGYFTSKKDESVHGYGIYNIKKAVQKYSGEVVFFTDEGNFRAEILLPQVIEEE